MKPRFQSLCLALVALASFALLSACGAARSYRLPLSASQAKDSFAPIASCADGQGLPYSEFDDSIHVKMDDTAWIQYMVQNDQYNMVLIVDDKKVPGPDLEAKFADAKAKGDELWACAKGHMGTQVNVNVNVSAPTSPAAAPDTVCGKLAACYAAIANNLCEQSGDASCEMSFRIEGEPDEPGCQDMLDAVPALVQPYQMVIPGYQIPAVCR